VEKFTSIHRYTGKAKSVPQYTEFRTRWGAPDFAGSVGLCLKRWLTPILLHALHFYMSMVYM
jgi:hypothetical protein